MIIIATGSRRVLRTHSFWLGTSAPGLNAARRFSNDIWLEAHSFMIGLEGLEGENQDFNGNVVQINFK